MICNTLKWQYSRKIWNTGHTWGTISSFKLMDRKQRPCEPLGTGPVAAISCDILGSTPNLPHSSPTSGE